MEDFGGKVSVVTGAANPRGIGFAIARRFAELGCKLVLADLDGDNAEDRASELTRMGTDAISVRTDMADYTSVEHLARVTYEEFGATHILVLNHVAPTGGVGHGLLSPEPGPWELHARVNLLGVVYGIKTFAHRMIAGGDHGHILATTSGAGATGTMYGNGPYASTKAAITSVMECLYGQLRDAEADIVAGLIFPGVTSTFATDEIGELVAENMRTYGPPTVLAQPEEVARFTELSIRRDSFWAHPDVDDDVHLSGGRHREAIEWESAIYRSRAEALVNRSAPDPYLWGPPNDFLENRAPRPPT